jgi:vacuole morphology and inheritance protein 14
MDDIQFTRVLNALVQLFFEDRPLLETRGALIIRKLCALLDCKGIYMSLASILNEKPDIEFLSTLVQTLNLILLTAPELAPLRNTLKDCFQPNASESDQTVFLTLFRCWCHNPVATFSLCLLAQSYDLSASLVTKFAEVDITVGLLMQIDKLVQLLESPIFVRLRLQLLDVSSNFHPDLLKSLYGLLMLLPQSQAYKTLSDRLSTVSSLKLHLSLSPSPTANAKVTTSNAVSTNKKSAVGIDQSSLLQHFEDTQRKHSIFRLALVSEKGLLKHHNLLSSGEAAASSSNTSI